MGLNDEAEKRRQAREWLRDSVPFSDRWEAAREHLGRALTDTERAVLKVMADSGLPMDPDTAGAIADAVMESFTDVVSLREVIAPEIWDGERVSIDAQAVREHVRTDMRRKLWVEMGDKGWLPTRQPRETVTRRDEPWGLVTIELRTTVRRAI